MAVGGGIALRRPAGSLCISVSGVGIRGGRAKENTTNQHAEAFGVVRLHASAV